MQVLLTYDSQFEALHFTNSRGTNLLVGLPKNHLYIGGGVIDKNGIPFFPNIPTEEIFTAPHKNKVNGKLVGTKPLIYGGVVLGWQFGCLKEGSLYFINGLSWLKKEKSYLI
jgi:aminopeptidase